MITYKKAPNVTAGNVEKPTSAKYNKLAQAFNDRLKGGFGDPTWRIIWYAHSLFRQVRNPADQFVWPPQDEWWKFYAHLNPNFAKANGVGWPETGPGEPEGSNVANPIMAFIFGLEAADLNPENLRLTVPLHFDGIDTLDGGGNINQSVIDGVEKYYPLYFYQNTTNNSTNAAWLAGFDTASHGPKTVAEHWDIGKSQRGGFDPTTGALSDSVIIQSRVFSKFRYPTRAPYLKSYSCYVPIPTLLGYCPPEVPDDPPSPNYQIKFTAISNTPETPVTFGGCSGVSGNVITYSGTCPNTAGHVAGVYYGDDAYYVYRHTGDGGVCLDVLKYTSYIEGPYEGGGRLTRRPGEQIDQALNVFNASFRGSNTERAELCYKVTEKGFDFQQVLTRQNYLAPSYGYTEDCGSGDEVVAQYPVFQVRNTSGQSQTYGTGQNLNLKMLQVEVCTGTSPIDAPESNLTSYSINGGFVFAGFYAVATKLTGTAKIYVYEGANLIHTIVLTADALGNAQTTYFFTSNITGAVSFRINTSDPVTLANNGLVRIEMAELYKMKPTLHDLYSILRMATAKSDISSSIDGFGHYYDTPKSISTNYLTYGSIINPYSSEIDYSEEVDVNPIYEAARLMVRDNLRLAPREVLVNYEVSGGKSKLYFRRYAYGLGQNNVPTITTPYDELLSTGEAAITQVQDVSVLEVGKKYLASYDSTVASDFSAVNDKQPFAPASSYVVYRGVRENMSHDGWASQDNAAYPIEIIGEADDAIFPLFTQFQKNVKATITRTTNFNAAITWNTVGGLRYYLDRVVTLNDNTTETRTYQNGAWVDQDQDPENYTVGSVVTSGLTDPSIPGNVKSIVYTVYVKKIKVFWKSGEMSHVTDDPMIQYSGDDGFTYVVQRQVNGGAWTNTPGPYTGSHKDSDTVVYVYIDDITETTDPATVNHRIIRKGVIHRSTDSIKVIKAEQTHSFKTGTTYLVRGYRDWYFHTDGSQVFFSNDTIRATNSDLKVTYNAVEYIIGQEFTVTNVHLLSTTIHTAGTGYGVGNVLTISGGTGTAAQLTVTSIGAGGAITGVSISNQGNYTAEPNLTGATVTGGAGSGAKFNLVTGDDYILHTGKERVYQKVLNGITYPNTYIVRAPAGQYATYPSVGGTNYSEGQLITPANGASDLYTISSNLVKVYRIDTATNANAATGFDIFENMAPSKVAVGLTDVKAGVTYKVKTTNGGTVSYNNVTYSNGQTLTGVANVTTYSFSPESSTARLYRTEGILATAPPGSTSNEWSMFISNNHYHHSESSIWKPDGYGDIITFLNNRCHFYSPDLASAKRGNLRLQFSHGQKPIIVSEAPSGYNYLERTHDPTKYNWEGPADCAHIDPNSPEYTTCKSSYHAKGVKDFYRSCQIYKPDYDIESVIEDPADANQVIVTLKGRLGYTRRTPSSFTKIVPDGGWTLSRENYLKGVMLNEPYRTDENTVIEYLIHKSSGTPYHCTKGRIGDSAPGSAIWTLTDDPWGACYPRFYFTRMIPYVHEDGNDTVQVAKDTKIVVDPFIQMEFYLRAMCGGFIDRESALRYDCKPNNGVSRLYDYTFENLCKQAIRSSSLYVTPTVTSYYENQRRLPYVDEKYNISWDYNPSLYTYNLEYRRLKSDGTFGDYELILANATSPVDLNTMDDGDPNTTDLPNGIGHANGSVARVEFAIRKFNVGNETSVDDVQPVINVRTNRIEIPEILNYTYKINRRYKYVDNTYSSWNTIVTGVNTSPYEDTSFVLFSQINFIEYELLAEQAFSGPPDYRIIEWNAQEGVKYLLERKVDRQQESEGDWEIIDHTATSPHTDNTVLTDTVTHTLTDRVELLFAVDGTSNLVGTTISWTNNGVSIYKVQRRLKMHSIDEWRDWEDLTELISDDTNSYTDSTPFNLATVQDKEYQVLKLTGRRVHWIKYPQLPATYEYKVSRQLTNSSTNYTLIHTATTDVTSYDDTAGEVTNRNGNALPHVDYTVRIEYSDPIVDIEYRVYATTNVETNRWMSPMPLAIREDKPKGFGPLPHTCLYAEIFNNMANAVNLLKMVRAELPVNVRWRRTTTSGGTFFSGEEGPISGFCNGTGTVEWNGFNDAFAMISGVPPQSGLTSAVDGWYENQKLDSIPDASRYSNITCSYYYCNNGIPMFIFYGIATNVEWQISPEQLANEAIPDKLKPNFRFYAPSVLAEITIKRSWENRVPAAQAYQIVACQGSTPGGNPTTVRWTWEVDSSSEVRCILSSGGTLPNPELTSMDLYLISTSTGNPGCCRGNGASVSTSITFPNSDQLVAAVTIPIVR